MSIQDSSSEKHCGEEQNGHQHPVEMTQKINRDEDKFERLLRTL